MTELTPQTLGSVISISKGKKHQITDLPSHAARRLIGIDDLRNDDLIRYTDDASGTEAISDDVLIAWDGANAGTIGFGKSGYIGSTIARLRVKSGVRLFTPFLGLYLKSKFTYLRQTATGATIPHINRSALEGIPLPVIEYDDQIRIAHLLGKVEGLIAQRKQHLQQLDDLLKSVFLEMFGDPMRNEMGWEPTTIGDSVEIQSGQVDPRELPYSEMLHVGGANIEPESGNFTALKQAKYESLISGKYLFDAKHVLYSKIRPYLNKVAKPDFQGICSADIYPIKPIGGLLNRDFLRMLLMSKSFLKYAANNSDRANIPKINRKALVAFGFNRPPIDLQNQFATIAKKVESIKSSYQQSLTDLEALYGALSQRAFKGELDLSRVPMPKPPTQHIGTVSIGDQAFVPEPVVQAAPAIHLPVSDKLPAALENTEARKVLIEEWLQAYHGQLRGTPFSVQDFMAAAQARLVELLPDNDFALSASDYEVIKAWVFDEIQNRKLKQSRDIICIDGRRQFGNQILLRARRLAQQ